VTVNVQAPDTDARHAEYFGSVLTALLGLNSAAGWVGASTNGSIGAVYDSNAIVYTSPAIAGFSASLEYAPGGVIKDRNHSANQSTALSPSTEYSLSKSTLVYADAGYVDNRGVMNQALEYGQPVAPGVGTSAFMVGLRHKF
jgi:predicted porin